MLVLLVQHHKSWLHCLENTLAGKVPELAVLSITFSASILHFSPEQDLLLVPAHAM
jgi:hypothetical protein